MSTPNPVYFSHDIDIDDLLEAGFRSVRAARKSIREHLELDPAGALEPLLIGSRRQRALAVDKGAEDAFKLTIKGYGNGKYLDRLTVVGKNSLTNTNLDLIGQQGVFAFADMVNGTDLLERKLSNWCSAIVFFRPNALLGRRILASMVALHNGKTFYATIDDPKVYVRWLDNTDEPQVTSGLSTVRNLNKASVCFYGQRAENFVELARYPLFQHLAGAKKLDDFRLYTLAGIPMVMNLIDNEVKTSRNIDAVFDIRGQKPHDVVPGAFLALKAGASLINLDTGDPMGLVDLERFLMRPAANDSKMKYVVASTKPLAKAISELLSPSIECEPSGHCVFSNLFQIKKQPPLGRQA